MDFVKYVENEGIELIVKIEFAMFLMCAKCAFLKYRCSILGLCETHNDLNSRMQDIDFIVKNKI